MATPSATLRRGRALPVSSAPLGSLPLGALPGMVPASESEGDSETSGTTTVYLYVSAAPPGATGICNGAIGLVGAGQGEKEKIDDFDTDTSRLADHCRARFHRARRRALLKWPWPEATAYLAGTAASADVVHPTYDFHYAYQIPVGAGCLAMREIVDVYGNCLKYHRVGLSILCNYQPAEFWWSMVLDLAAGFSEGLVRCIEYELAIDLCGLIITGGEGAKRRRGLHQEYRELALPDAQRQAQDQQYDAINVEAPTRWDEIY